MELGDPLYPGAENRGFLRSDGTGMRESARDRMVSIYGSASGASREIAMSNSSSTEILKDAVKVEITDIECNSSTNITIGALRRCKQQIVTPFYTILTLVGWRPFGYGRVSFGNLRWRIFNTVYLTVLISLVLFAYTYQVLVCQYGLSEADIAPPKRRTTPAPTPPSGNSTHFTASMLTILPAMRVSTTAPDEESDDQMPICVHLFTTYVIPNLLHAIAFIMGIIHFRVHYAEDLLALMEKVFLYCQSSPLRQVSQWSLIVRLRGFLFGMIVWLLSCIVTHVLNDIGFTKYWGNTRSTVFRIRNGDGLSYVLMVIDMAGYTVISAVTMTVLFNYIVNCEMIIFYADSVMNKLQERSLNLRVAVKDLHAIKMATKKLNGTTSFMASIIILIIVELVSIGTNILVRNEYDDPVIWAYRSFFVLTLIPVGVLPLIQAARVNAHCQEFREKVLDIRTYGYQDAGQLELDSIVLFVIANRFQAKLFYVPIRASYLIALTVIVSFVMLLLLQNGVFSKNSLL